MGALIGLFGQGMAYASGPAYTPKAAASRAMPGGMDCTDMASAQKRSPERPCKGLTLACIAQMGCVVPMTFDPQRPLVERAPVAQLAATWPPAPMLAGREVAPEPEPPTA